MIVCGGLGPTQDDITREAIAQVMGVELVRDDAVADVIRELFASRGRTMPDNNLRQADVPVGRHRHRAAHRHRARADLPGGRRRRLRGARACPYEMKEMLERAVLPDLAARAGVRQVIASRVLRTWGESESRVAELLDPRLRVLDETGTATIAFLASGIEGIKVRLTARGDSEEHAKALLDAEEAEVRAALGDIVFSGDDLPMEAEVGRLLEAQGRTLAIAESLTGGLAASRVVNVPGSSDWFKGGVVAYDSQVKFDLLDVPEGPVVSEAAAKAMADGVRRAAARRRRPLHHRRGRARPSRRASRRAPCGSAWRWATRSRRGTLRLPGDRDRVRQLSVISLMDLLRRKLLGLITPRSSSRTRSRRGRGQPQLVSIDTFHTPSIRTASPIRSPGAGIDGSSDTSVRADAGPVGSGEHDLVHLAVHLLGPLRSTRAAPRGTAAAASSHTSGRSWRSALARVGRAAVGGVNSVGDLGAGGRPRRRAAHPGSGIVTGGGSTGGAPDRTRRCRRRGRPRGWPSVDRAPGSPVTSMTSSTRSIAAWPSSA